MRRLKQQARNLLRFVRLSGELEPYLRPHRGRLLTAFGLSLAFAALRLAEPWPLQIVFDQAILGKPSQIPGVDPLALVGGDRMTLLAVSAAAILLLALVAGSIYYLQSVLLARVGQQIIRDLREDVFHQMLRLSMLFHRKNDTGDLLMRMTGDMVFLREMILATLITMTSELILLVSALVLMATLNWQLTLITIVLAPGLFFLFRFFRTRMVAASRKQRRREGRVAQQIAEVLLAVPMIQSFTAEAAEDERFRHFCKGSERAGLRGARLEAGMQRMVEIVIAVGTCLVLWFGVRQILQGDLTPGVFLVFLAYLRTLFKPVRKLSKVTERTSRAAAATERILEVLRAKRDVRDRRDSVPAPALAGAIRFEKVTFSYEDGTVALREIDFEIRPGEQVALVGTTGAGKSTLFSLILRFARPTGGRVYFDEQKAKRFTLQSLRRQIALLPQEPYIVAGSIRDNLLYGKPDATDDDLWKALEAANLEAFVRGLPDGLDSVVASRGQSLSGGQKQRLAIARAILKDAPILLLDEPTTGLDPNTEREVLAALDRLRRGRTTITIAHRLSTVEASDRVLVLERGRLVGNDRPSVLAARPGPFRALLDAGLAGGADSRTPDAGPSRPGAMATSLPANQPVPSLLRDPDVKGIERLWREGTPNRFLRELATLAPIDRHASVVCVKQRLGQRAVLRVQSGSQTHYVKLVRGRSGDERLQVHRALETLAPAANLHIPHACGWNERYRALIFEELPGVDLGALPEDRRRSAFRATGRALARVHAGFAVPENHDAPDKESVNLSRAVSRSRSARIGWEPPEAWVEARNQWWEARPESGVPVALHGDFYPAQVRVEISDLKNGVGILDWDGFCAGDPERDVANFVAHLELDGVRGVLSPGGAEAATESFLDGYLSVRSLDAALLDWYRRATLLRLAVLHADPTFGAHPPNGEQLPLALLERAQGAFMTTSRPAPATRVPLAPTVLAWVFLGWCAVTMGVKTARADLLPESWGGSIAAVYESRPVGNPDPIDPVAGTGDGRYWFAVPEEWGGSATLWAQWKLRNRLGRARIEAGYERNQWSDSGVLARDQFQLDLRQAISKRSEFDLSLEYSPQIYSRHRADKDAQVGEPRFRPEAYANYQAELAYSRDWSGFLTALYGTFEYRDENRWFNERDRRGLGVGIELDAKTGLATRWRPYYEFQVTRSRNRPDLGSDLSHREHAVGLRLGQELQALGATWILDLRGQGKSRSYTTNDPTDTSRYHQRIRSFYGNARLAWSRRVWSPFLSGSYYRRLAGSSSAETVETDSDKRNVRLGVAFEFN